MYVLQLHTSSGDDTCDGDSGGPLLARERRERPMYVLGLVAFGTLRCGLGAPSAYTDVASFWEWIIANMRD